MPRSPGNIHHIFNLYVRPSVPLKVHRHVALLVCTVGQQRLQPLYINAAKYNTTFTFLTTVPRSSYRDLAIW